MMETGKKVIELNINDVLPNRFQPRIKFNEEAINELSKSIKEHGVIQPIVVRPIGDKFEIIAGERRYKASLLAEKTTIPAIITDLNDKDSAEVALIENVQRENLTPIEEAISYKKILDMGYITQDALATKLGKTQSTVANKLRLLNLDDDVQEALLNEKISERHARSLLKLTDKEKQRQMLNKIIKERLTVRRADEEIEKMLSGQQINFEEEKPKENIQQEQKPNNFNFVFNQQNSNSIDKIEQPQQTEQTQSVEQPTAEHFKFINQIQPQALEPEPLPQQEPETPAQELESTKFFNILETEQPQQQAEQSFDFNKMFINPSASTENPLLEEINEIENSINNSNNIKPIQEQNNIQSQPTIEQPQNNEQSVEPQLVEQEEKFDDFDDDMEFIEEEPDTTPQEQTINSNIENSSIIIPSKINNFKEVLEEIRNCSKKIEDSGFEVETEEIDLDGAYQVTFKIKKNN